MKIVKTADSATIFNYSWSQDPSSAGTPGNIIYGYVAETIESSNAAYQHCGSPEEFYDYWNKNVGDIKENGEGAIDVVEALTQYKESTGVEIVIG